MTTWEGAGMTRGRRALRAFLADWPVGEENLTYQHPSWR